jgi:hypothetical protein
VVTKDIDQNSRRSRAGGAWTGLELEEGGFENCTHLYYHPGRDVMSGGGSVDKKRKKFK